MGLDSVELILEVEDKFSVKIPDDKYGDIQTAGDLFDYLDGIKHFAKDSCCASIDVFCNARRSIATLFSIPREQIRPKTPLSSVIPLTNRRLEWQRFAQALNVELPSLVLPSWITLLLIILAEIVALSSLAFFSGPLAIAMFMAFGVVSILIFIILYQALSFRIAVEIPGRCRFVRDAVYYSLVKNQPASAETSCGLTRAEAWRLLQSVICEQLAVSPSEVHRNAKFVDDLGMN